MLAASQKMVYNVHEKKDLVSGAVKPNKRGRHGNQRKISKEDHEAVIKHKKSFKVVEAHYCRAKTSKEYLESSLNIEKMYNLYKDFCTESGRNPVKPYYYRNVFNNSFNYGFHIPKTDRCDQCEEYAVKKRENIPITAADEVAHVEHIEEKQLMREVKKQDKEYQSEDVCIVVFHRENVITLPKADVGCFLYKRKLTLYNLTAHTVKRGYCAIWNDALSGRAASVFLRTMENIVQDHPNATTFKTWSDSYVPQNRNQGISQAVIEFVSRHQHIKTVNMKYSIPGHSAVQEVGSLHSQIEHAMRFAEFYP